jgi:hypothetical protein
LEKMETVKVDRSELERAAAFIACLRLKKDDDTFTHFLDINKKEIGHHIKGFDPVKCVPKRVWGESVLREHDIEVNPDGPMMIKISQGAHSRARSVVNAGQSSNEWQMMLLFIQDMWMRVETQHLFDSQYNVAPLTEREMIPFRANFEKNLGELGYGHEVAYLARMKEAAEKILMGNGPRIMNHDVVEVHNDQRPYFFKCYNCGEQSHKHLVDGDVTRPCPKCAKYSLESLFPG